MRASGIRQVLQPLGRPMRGHEDRVEVEVFANRIRVWPGDPPEVTLHTWRTWRCSPSWASWPASRWSGAYSSPTGSTWRCIARCTPPGRSRGGGYESSGGRTRSDRSAWAAIGSCFMSRSRASSRSRAARERHRFAIISGEVLHTPPRRGSGEGRGRGDGLLGPRPRLGLRPAPCGGRAQRGRGREPSRRCRTRPSR